MAEEMNINLPDLLENNVLIVPGEIQFPDFRDLEGAILNLTAAMQDVEVTEENVRQAKTLAAAVRKQVNGLDDERKRVKKLFTAPLSEFEDKVLHLKKLVVEAEEIIRSQVRALEEEERKQKTSRIMVLYGLHSKQYNLLGILGFDDFFRREYGNKTYSLAKIEEELVQWLVNAETDIQFLNQQPNADALLMEYKDTKNVTVAMKNVQQHEDFIRELEAKREQEEAPKNPDYSKRQKQYRFTVKGERNADMLRGFLQTTGIEFTES